MSLRRPRGRGARVGCALGLAAAVWVLASCARSESPAPPPPPPGPALLRIEPVTDRILLPDAADLDGLVTERELAIARGEYHPFSFVVVAGDAPLEALRIEVEDAKGLARDGISVDVRWVQDWFQGDGAWKSRLNYDVAYRRVPELLVKDPELVRVDRQRRINEVCLHNSGVDRCEDVTTFQRRVDRHLVQSIADFPVRDARTLRPARVRAREIRQVWFTVRIAADAPPGPRRIRVVARHAGGTLTRTVPLRVLPFELPPSPIEYALYYRGKLAREGSISGEFKNEAQYRAELEDLLAHGVTNVTSYQSPDDPELFRRHLRIRAELGMNRGPFYCLGIVAKDVDSTAELERLTGAVRAVQALALEHGFPRVLVYGMEEVRGRELDRQRRAMAALRRIGSGVFIAGYEGTVERVGDVLALFVRAGATARRFADEAHRVGLRIYSYNNPQVGAEDPLVYRTRYGLDLYLKGYDGVMNYAYQTTTGRTWNDWDHRRVRDHVFAYPTVDGVIPTLAWEGFREAVDDVRVFHALERAAANAAAAPCIDGEGRARVAALVGSIRNGTLRAPLHQLRERMLGSLRALAERGVTWDRVACEGPSGAGGRGP